MAAGGMLSPSCEADGCEPDLIQLGIESCMLYPQWIEEIESDSKLPCGYQESGTLLVALHHDHNQELEHLVAFQTAHRLSHEWLSRRTLKRKSPNLTRHIGGLWFARDHHVNPRLLQQSLRRALEHQGVTFLEGNWTLRLSTEPDGSCSVTGLKNNDAVIEADTYVLSDGAWSKEHIPSLPLRPVKGQFLILGPKSGTTPIIDTVIRTPDVYIIPRDHGQIYLGATMEEEDFDPRQTAGATLDLLYHAFQILPAVYEMIILEQGHGFRPALRDNQPMIGQSSYGNLWFNLGHYRHGIMLAPAAADLLANAMLNKVKIPDAFSPNRFGPLHINPM
jgi:glycine oxidase